MKITHKIAYMVIGVGCTLAIGSASIAALGEAGTQTDPVVTKSYVEKRIAELDKKLTDANKLQIEQQMATVQGQLSELLKASGSSGEDFKLVQLKNGDTVMLGNGAQFILRAGLAKAIGGAGGGLSDLTQGKDIGTDQDITTNHLLLVPKDDGRGVKILYDSWALIKGSYQIKN